MRIALVRLTVVSWCLLGTQMKNKGHPAIMSMLNGERQMVNFLHVTVHPQL
jgi:hypothetical protein